MKMRLEIRAGPWLKYLITLCYCASMRSWAWAGVLALAIAATASHAQLQRQLPASGKLGELIGRQHPFPLVQISNQILRLAPGGLIYDQDNRTILHGVLPEQANVWFVLDIRGEVARIYLLRPEELAQLERAGTR
jgi:hypothetical protein